MAEQTTSPSPPVVQVQSESNNRTPFWILLSVVIGFLLPVCSCGALLVVSIFSLGVAGGGSTSSPGVGDAVAIVRVEGTILSSDDTDFSTDATSGLVIADLRAAAADPTVKAIILRVDSPGGSVTGSAQIYEAIQEIEKPVVTSMASLAASGGYYISAPTDYIFARPDTFTGSIGVIISLFNAEELINEIGVDVINITSANNKAIGSAWEELTPEQREILQTIVDEAFEEFIDIVAEGRDMGESQVRELADGRIYTGRQALDHGLVDELGNLQDAIDEAAALGNISGEPRIVEYERLPGLEDFLQGFSARLDQNKADEVQEIIEQFTMPAVEYRYVGPTSQ